MSNLAHSDFYDIVAENDKEGRLANRSIIEEYKLAMQKHVGSERGMVDEINDKGLTERLFDGVYARELIIPKGITMVSELWNRERLWVIITGRVSILSEMGRKEITAPYVGIAPFGTRIALYAHEETRWMAVCNANDCEDLKDTENKIKVADYSGFTYPWDLLKDKGEKL